MEVAGKITYKLHISILKFKLIKKKLTGAGARLGAEIEAEVEEYIEVAGIEPEPEDGPAE